MIQSFILEFPKNIYFGSKSRENLPEILKLYGKKVLFITGSHWFPGSGWKEKITRLVRDFHSGFYSCPSGEPTVESITTLIAKTREVCPDVIVGIGGGTVLDTVKAVAGLVHTGESVEDFLEGIGKGMKIEKKGIPWIAIPTTSGTGAEVTKNSVIKSPIHKVKKSLRSPFLLADAIIVDPDFTLDLPLYISGIAGMDALVQLIESFVSIKAKPIPRALVKQAFPVMLHALKTIPSHPSDIDARTGAAYGSMISGLALANSGLGAVHGFASAFGGLYTIPHGHICAVMLNPVIRANADVITSGLKELCKEFLRPNDDPIQWITREVDTLLREYGIRPDFKEYGIDPEMAELIAEKATGSSMSGNPRKLTREEKKALVLEVI